MADAAPATTATAATPVKKGRKPKDGAKKPKSNRPPTMQLVIEAIEAEKDPKGTSVLAIKKHIMANNQVSSAKFLNHMLRRALEAGLAEGKLSRPKGQTETSLLMGRYRLAAKEKKPKAVEKPKKVAKSPAKKAAAKPKKAAKSPAKKAAAKPKVKTPKKKPAAAAKKAKSPKKVKKTPKKSAAKKSPKKAAKKA